MVISIQPVTMILTIIALSNCVMSFGKSKLMNKCHVILSSVLSVLGIVGMIIIRPSFVDRLTRNAQTQNFNSDFVAWAIEKFDAFAVVSIIVTCSIVMFLLVYILLNKKGFVWANMTIIVITLIIINFIAGVWYSLGTINKLFDIASYISRLTTAEFFALHIPLVVKRILLQKK